MRGKKCGHRHSSEGNKKKSEQRCLEIRTGGERGEEFPLDPQYVLQKN